MPVLSEFLSTWYSPSGHLHTDSICIFVMVLFSPLYLLIVGFSFILMIKREDGIAKHSGSLFHYWFRYSVGYSTFPCRLLASYANVCWAKPSQNGIWPWILDKGICTLTYLLSYVSSWGNLVVSSNFVLSLILKRCLVSNLSKARAKNEAFLLSFCLLIAMPFFNHSYGW